MFTHRTAIDMRICDWFSDVGPSDLKCSGGSVGADLSYRSHGWSLLSGHLAPGIMKQWGPGRNGSPPSSGLFPFRIVILRRIAAVATETAAGPLAALLPQAAGRVIAALAEIGRAHV